MTGNTRGAPESRRAGSGRRGGTHASRELSPQSRVDGPSDDEAAGAVTRREGEGSGGARRDRGEKREREKDEAEQRGKTRMKGRKGKDRIGETRERQGRIRGEEREREMNEAEPGEKTRMKGRKRR